MTDCNNCTNCIHSRTANGEYSGKEYLFCSAACDPKETGTTLKHAVRWSCIVDATSTCTYFSPKLKVCIPKLGLREARGISNDQWVYGIPTLIEGVAYIQKDTGDCVPVQEETISYKIGNIEDSFGVPVYEGDFIKTGEFIPRNSSPYVYMRRNEDGTITAVGARGEFSMEQMVKNAMFYKVVGSIFDKELFYEK